MAVIAFSSLPLLRDFGLIVAMNVTVALLSALVFLPPMLVWAEERGWVTRGMRPRPRRSSEHRGRPGPPPPSRPDTAVPRPEERAASTSAAVT